MVSGIISTYMKNNVIKELKCLTFTSGFAISFPLIPLKRTRECYAFPSPSLLW